MQSALSAASALQSALSAASALQSALSAASALQSALSAASALQSALSAASALQSASRSCRSSAIEPHVPLVPVEPHARLEPVAAFDALVLTQRLLLSIDDASSPLKFGDCHWTVTVG